MSIKTLMIIHAVVTVIVIFGFVALAVTCTKEVEERGLKNIVNEVWEGKQ